jgi:hypothetical protein
MQRKFLEKLMDPQLFEKFVAFCGTEMLTTVFVRPRRLSKLMLNQINPVHTVTS